MVFTSEMAEQIHQKYLDKNWNLYPTKIKDAKENIRNGPASTLEKSASYVMLPLTENPNNPESVFDAMEALALKRGRTNMPGINFPYGYQPCLGITLEDSHVQFHNRGGTKANYFEALKLLGTLTDARVENN